MLSTPQRKKIAIAWHEKKHPKIEISCLTCGKRETVRFGLRYKKFCSIRCRGKYFVGEKNNASRELVRAKLRGRTLSRKTRKRLSLSLTGRKLSSSHLESLRRSTVKRYQEGNFNYKGYFFSQLNNAMIGYRSGQERLCMQIFEQLPNLTSWKYEKDLVPYIDETGRKRITIPDFHLYWRDGTETLIEYKPRWKLKNERERLKLKADKRYARSKNWKFEVWTETKIK